MLFDNIKKREINLCSQKKCKIPPNVEVANVLNVQLFLGTIRAFLQYMKEHLLRERPELFMQGDSVRPGILVLVNDTDYELLGELDYELQSNDNIHFVSTLHGG